MKIGFLSTMESGTTAVIETTKADTLSHIGYVNLFTYDKMNILYRRREGCRGSVDITSKKKDKVQCDEDILISPSFSPVVFHEDRSAIAFRELMT